MYVVIPLSHVRYKNPFEKVLGETDGLCVSLLVGPILR